MIAGCGQPPSVDLRISVPWPTSGDVATYDSELDLNVLVGDPIAIRDVSGDKVVTLPLTVSYDSGKGVAGHREFIDQEGRKVLVYAECVALGNAFRAAPEECKAERTPSASWMEYGLPGALGVSRLWGRVLDGNDITVDYSVLGQNLSSTYRVQFDGSLAKCARLELVDGGLSPLGQYFTFLSEIPTGMTVCDGEPFPAEIVAGRGLMLRRVDLRVAEEARHAELGRSHDPSALGPSGDAKPLSQGVPSHDGYATELATVREAVSYLRTTPGASRDFLNADPQASIARADVILVSHGGVGLARSTMSEVYIAMRDAGGRELEATLSAQCAVGQCVFAREQEAVSQPGTLDTAPPLAIPLAIAVETFKRTTGIASESMLHIDLRLVDSGNGQAPLGQLSSYLYVIRGSSGAGLGFPAFVRMDAGTGAVLAFQGATPEQAEEMTGVRPE